MQNEEKIQQYIAMIRQNVLSIDEAMLLGSIETTMSAAEIRDAIIAQGLNL